MTAGEKEEH
uniref:Uncharacterized protein n=1 Tax=Anguilla anguilla TaxID=7936 RepID=A0A0E9S7K1_ANGAN